MKNKTKIIVSVFFVIGILIISGCGCKPQDARKYSLSLEVWGMFDDKEALNRIFETYKKINPNVARIEYKKISADTYKQEINDALAAGQGPDIFLIHNDWLLDFENKIAPTPQMQIPIPGLISEQKFRENFVDVTAADFIKDGKIYATPLSVDSLGLYYNKDLFNQAGIVSPPTSWNEFIQDVRKMTIVNSFNEIAQAGAAIGTAYNINRSTDILNLLMLQGNTEIIDSDGRISFDKYVMIDGKNVSPGENALNFYTQFAQSGSLNYTWNPNLHYSIDAFSEGRAAMMFNYSWHIKTISEKAPKLNFAIAPVPQFNENVKVNFANYWGYAVAKNKIPQSANNDPSASQEISNEDRIGEAWLFLSYLTTKPDGSFVPPESSASVGNVVDPNMDPAFQYLKTTGMPAARRDIIEAQKSDPRIGVFAADNLIAKSWRKSNPDAVESIFAEMIDKVNKGQSTVHEAIQAAAQRVRNLSSVY